MEVYPQLILVVVGQIQDKVKPVMKQFYKTAIFTILILISSSNLFAKENFTFYKESPKDTIVCTETLGEDWVDNQWVNNLKYSFTYNTNGYNTEKVNQKWSNSQWANTLKINYAYDSNGNWIEWLEMNWSETSSQWVNSAKHKFTYDSDGNITEHLGQRWFDSEWVYF